MEQSRYISLADLCKRTACDRDTARSILDASGHRYRKVGQDALLTGLVASRIAPAMREAGKVKKARRAAFLGLPNAESVYFIRDGDFVKIGAALDARKRLADLQVANPRPLTLLLELDGGFTEERRLQGVFADFLVHGEWFRLEGPLKAFVDAECAARDANSHEKSHAPGLRRAVAEAMELISERRQILAREADA